MFYNTFGTLVHNYKNMKLNKLMKSDYFGAHFKTLLDDLICDKRLNFCDFLPIHSLVGVVLVNQYDKTYIEHTLNLPKSRQ